MYIHMCDAHKIPYVLLNDQHFANELLKATNER